jgi:MFS family permease
MLMCTLAMITYLDRALNGNAKDSVMSAVGRDEADYNLLIVAFQLAYALFEIPTGWLGDTYGPRKTLLRVVLWWSVFIGIMSLAGLPLLGSGLILGYGGLIVVQFLFGMGEAGAFPNISKVLYNWFPASQRAIVQGAVWLSSRFMGGLTPFIWTLLVPVLGLSWRLAVGLFSVAGLCWWVVFFLRFRNHPREHPDCNEAEIELVGQGKSPHQSVYTSVPWRKLFGQANLWYLCGMYFCANFGWYFLMYFLPKYMKQSFGLEQSSGIFMQLTVALMAGAPLLIGGIGCIWGGRLSDAYIARTGNRTWGRRRYGILGFALCSICYLVAIFSQGSPYIVTASIALVGFFSDLTLGPSWATAQDVGRRYAAVVSGCMNMIGNIGAALSTFITSLIISSFERGDEAEQGYTLCLSLYAVAYAIGVVFWWLVDANKPLIED